MFPLALPASCVASLPGECAFVRVIVQARLVVALLPPEGGDGVALSEGCGKRALPNDHLVLYTCWRPAEFLEHKNAAGGRRFDHADWYANYFALLPQPVSNISLSNPFQRQQSMLTIHNGFEQLGSEKAEHLSELDAHTNFAQQRAWLTRRGQRTLDAFWANCTEDFHLEHHLLHDQIWPLLHCRVASHL